MNTLASTDVEERKRGEEDLRMEIAKRVSRSWYAASVESARNCNRHGHV